MDRGERDRLRARCVEGWKPGQSVEVSVHELRDLLDTCDALDVFDPYRTAWRHWRRGHAVEGCQCTSCAGYRARAQLDDDGEGA